MTTIGYILRRLRGFFAPHGPRDRQYSVHCWVCKSGVMLDYEKAVEGIREHVASPVHQYHLERGKNNEQ